MKHFAFVALLGLFATPLSQAAGPAAGKVLSLDGKAWKLEGKQQIPLQAGAELHDHDRIKTDAGSRMTFLLGHDVAALLNPGTDATIEKTHGKDWTVRLQDGSILSKVKNPEKRPNHFQIRTRSATMGVRGTVFFVKAVPSEPVFLCTCNGKIEVSSADGHSHTEVSGTHHDFPKTFKDGKGDIASRMEAAPMGNEHSDADGAALEKALEENQ